jgi:hypothetical protein
LTVVSNQLEGTYLALLNHLSNNQQLPEPEPVMMEDVPMVEDEAEEVEGEAEEVVEEVIEEVIEQAREEAEQQEQEYEPYQLTRYYRSQLKQFEID